MNQCYPTRHCAISFKSLRTPTCGCSNIDDLIVASRRIRTCLLPEERVQEVAHDADDQRTEKRGPKSLDGEPIHNPPGEPEQEGVDEQDEHAERKDVERQREEDQ